MCCWIVRGWCLIYRARSVRKKKILTVFSGVEKILGLRVEKIMLFLRGGRVERNYGFSGAVGV
jgi:hypothetical protein